MKIKSLTINPSYPVLMFGESGNAWTIEIPSGTVNANKIILQNSHATGGAAFNAPLNNGNTDGGGNTGWNFGAAPSVVTLSAQDITATSFLAEGRITDTSGVNATRRGFCYKEGTSGDPTIADSVVYEDGDFGEGSYTLTISGLEYPGNYRFRAYAVGPNGIGYADNTIQVATSPRLPSVVTLSAQDIAAESFLAEGIIVDTGGINATRRGFCYKAGTSGDPTIADSIVYEDGDFGEGSYTLTISGLQYAENYRFRAYAVNSDGISYSSNVIMIATLPMPPSVDTQSVKYIFATSFSAIGNITNTGGENATRRGFCYKQGVSGDPTIADSVVYEDGDFGGGSYTMVISSLQSLTTYRLRAFAENSGGVGYGDIIQIATSSGAPPDIVIGEDIEIISPGEHAKALWMLFPLELAGVHENDLALEGKQLDDAQASAELLLREMFPQTADDTITDWERVYGLTPDPADTLQMRQTQIIIKMRELGGLSIPYFMTLAANMGYDNITIEELEPNTDGYGPEGIFRWRITFTGTPVYYFRAGRSRAGEPLVGGSVPTVMEGIFEELKPAHTQVIFAYA